jgi:group I intron endonuclease
MVNGIIYCAISPSNKKYYGYSSLSLEQRKAGHKDRLLRGCKSRFFSAIRKYGWGKFKWEIIEEFTAEDKKELHNILCEHETYWIDKDRTYLKEYGYNMTHGGDGRLGSEMSAETKDNLIKKLTGRSTERKGKSFKSEMIQKYGEKEGIKKYNDWIKKTADSHCKPILQLDKNDNFIKEWPSIKMAHDNGFEGTNICACLKGKRKTHKKYKWRYK